MLQIHEFPHGESRREDKAAWKFFPKGWTFSLAEGQTAQEAAALAETRIEELKQSGEWVAR